MTNDNRPDVEIEELDRWVDQQLSSLEVPDSWHPNPAARVSEAQRRRTARTSAGWRLGGATLAVVLVVSVPSARAFGMRCVAACVNVATRPAQLWQDREPHALAVPAIGLALGDVAPDLLGIDANGAEVRASALRGKIVVINFWATWCPPCRREIPLLNDLAQHFGPQGVEVIGVSVDEDGWPAIKAFRADTPVDYRLALASDEIAGAFGGVTSLPMTYVLDRNGRVTMKTTGLLESNALTEQVRALLGQRTP